MLLINARQPYSVRFLDPIDPLLTATQLIALIAINLAEVGCHLPMVAWFPPVAAGAGAVQPRRGAVSPQVHSHGYCSR